MSPARRRCWGLSKAFSSLPLAADEGRLGNVVGPILANEAVRFLYGAQTLTTRARQPARGWQALSA